MQGVEFIPFLGVRIDHLFRVLILKVNEGFEHPASCYNLYYWTFFWKGNNYRTLFS